MVSFIRRLFGRKSGPAPAIARIAQAIPQGKSATPGTPAESPAQAAATGQAQVPYRPTKARGKQAGIYTSPLGLSEADRSGIALKTLTGE